MARVAAACILLFLAASAFAQMDAPGSDETSDLINDRNTLLLVERLLSRSISGSSKFEKANNILPPTRKRTCYFNAGMSHSCDYKDLVSAVDEANHWSSEQTPGRRKRHSNRLQRATSIHPRFRLANAN